MHHQAIVQHTKRSKFKPTRSNQLLNRPISLSSRPSMRVSMSRKSSCRGSALHSCPSMLTSPDDPPRSTSSPSTSRLSPYRPDSRLMLERLALIEPAILSVDEVARFVKGFAKDGVETVGLETHDEAGHDEGSDAGVVEGEGMVFEVGLQLESDKEISMRESGGEERGFSERYLHSYRRNLQQERRIPRRG